MRPALAPGDIVWLSKRAPKPGDIVLVDHPRYAKIIKRLGHDGDLQGDNPRSTSSEKLGRLDDSQLIGTAVLRISPSGVTRLRARHPY